MGIRFSDGGDIIPKGYPKGFGKWNCGINSEFRI